MAIRIKDHIRRLRKGNHANAHLSSAWDKHGEDAFRFFVIEKTSIDALLEREAFHVNAHKSFDRNLGFNVTPVIDMHYNREPRFGLSENKKAHLDRLADMKRGKPMREDWRQNIIDGHAKNPKPVWWERQNVRCPLLGVKRIFSEETKIKMSVAAKVRAAEGRLSIKKRPREVVDRFISLIKSGVDKRDASMQCGISVSCGRTWILKHAPEFAVGLSG